MSSKTPEGAGAKPDITDAAFVANPYPVLNALREAESVGQDALGLQWYVTRHDDVDRLLPDRRLSRDLRNAAPGTAGALILGNANERGDYQPSMLFLDPPDHDRLRGLVSKAFTPRSIEAMRPRAARIADELLDAVRGQATFDLVLALAQPLPTIVIAEMIGVDAADQRQFKEWTDQGIRSLDPMASAAEKEAVRAAGVALKAYLERIVAARRAAPHDDLVSRLIAAQEHGDQLTDRELVTMLGLLLDAGNVTTTDLIGNGVLALLEHPAEWRKLQDNPALIPNAVEEMLRFDSPVVEGRRIVLTDIEVGGAVIAAGQTIATSLAAANHDPRAYPDADRFDVTRRDTHHHSFGGGLHYCLGAPLARMEGQVAVEALLRRFPNMRLAPGETPVRRTMPSFRGVASLMVRVD